MCIITTSTKPTRFPAAQPTVKVLDYDQRRMALLLNVLPPSVQPTPITQTITTPGDGNFIVPAGVTSLTLAITGAGGNGGAGAAGQGGCGGGGGAYAGGIITVIPGQVIPYHVSAAGDGAITWFGGAAINFADDGTNGGTGALTQGNGGGASGPGPPTVSGGGGGNCVDGVTGGGGGGGSAGSAAGAGHDGSDAVLGGGGAGGAAVGSGGAGGHGGNTGVAGTAGGAPGGGGGGGGVGVTAGGAGAGGQIVITYELTGCIAGVLRTSTADPGVPFKQCNAPTILDREQLFDLLDGPFYWDDLSTGAVLQGYEVIKTGELPVKERAG